jgi:REP element-mobilizing transposase RayT
VLKRPPVVDLTKPEVAQLMVGALLHFDCERYWLYDYTLMPDHVHAILKPIDTDGTSEPLHAITHSLKSWTANQINELLGREGAVWQQETHDHIIRNQADYLEKAGYIYDNPYDKHLVPFGEEWRGGVVGDQILRSAVAA